MESIVSEAFSFAGHHLPAKNFPRARLLRAASGVEQPKVLFAFARMIAPKTSAIPCLRPFGSPDLLLPGREFLLPNSAAPRRPPGKRPR